MSQHLREGDRVRITGVPGRWRVTECNPPWYWVEPKDSNAQELANLALDGRVAFRQRDMIPDDTDQERLVE